MTRYARRTSSLLVALVLAFSAMAGLASAQPADPQAPPEDPPGDASGQQETPPGQAERDDGDDQAGDPEGVAARGTVKVEGLPLEPETANEVHAGCSFGLSFWGFREQTAPVVFTLQPPSGTDEIGRIDVALDEARGNDLSAETVVDLTEELSGYPPVQAAAYDYKVRVDVVVAERGESGVITKTATVFLDCPEAMQAALDSGLVALPEVGAQPATGPDADSTAGAAGEGVESADDVAGAGADARVPVGGVAAGAGGTADDGLPVTPLAVVLVALTAAVTLRREATAGRG